MMGARHYEVIIEPSVRRTLAKMPRETSARLIRRIEALGENPHPPGAVKLFDHEAYRVRVRDYRITYAVLDDRLAVLIVDVGHRRDIYRGW